MRKPLVHKKKGMPGVYFLSEAFRYRMRQRVQLQLASNENWEKWFEEVGINPKRLVFLNGIFIGFWKKSQPIKSTLTRTGPIEIWLRFSDVCFEQDGKRVRAPFSRKSRKAKRGEWQFRVTEFKGLDWGKNTNIPELVTQADS